MRIESLERTEAFITKDGSEIRELAGTPTGNSVRPEPRRGDASRQAPRPTSTATASRRRSTSSRPVTACMRLGDEEAEVSAGDTVVISPGTPHKLWNTGVEPLKLLCCCAPPYSHEDTFMVA